MDVDRPHCEFSGLGCDGTGRRPAGHQNLLLHHPVPQQQLPTEELCSSTHGPAPSEYFNGRLHISSASASPVPHVHPHSPRFPSYPPHWASPAQGLRIPAITAFVSTRACATCRVGSILGLTWSRQRLCVPCTSRAVLWLSTISSLHWTLFTR